MTSQDHSSTTGSPTSPPGGADDPRPRREHHAKVQTLKILVHPHRNGAAVGLVLATWDRGRRTDRILAREQLDVGEHLPLDEPGSLLLALSDWLAGAALRY